MTDLHEAAATGDTERLQDLLAQPKVDIDGKDDDWEERTALFWAVINNHAKSVRILLQAGADPTVINCEDKTAAHYAAESGHYELLKLLIEYGCDVTAKDKHRDTPMDYALMYGNLECAQLINMALKGEVSRKKLPGDWLEPHNAVPLAQSAPGKKHSFMSLLTGLRQKTEQDEARRRRRSGGTKQRR